MSSSVTDSQAWPSHGMIGPDGSHLILRSVPPGFPKGDFRLFDLSKLTDSQRRESTAFHELGHAMTYLHFGIPVAIQMYAQEGADARVNAWHESREEASDDELRLCVAAGEAAAVRWTEERSLSSPMENLVNEIICQADRRTLRDDFGVTFGQGGEHDFDALLERAAILVDRYWHIISKVGQDLVAAHWWGWDEASEKLGSSDLVTPLMRDTSEAIRRAHAETPGEHTYSFPSAQISVETGEEGWRRFTYTGK